MPVSSVSSVAARTARSAAVNPGWRRQLRTPRMSASLKPTTREWLSTARNYALYSNQGGIYDDVVKYLKLS